MTSDNVKARGLADRVRGILMRPREEWRAIDGEATTAADLYRSYVLPLAAIGPVASLVGGQVFGVNLGPLGIVRAPIGTAVTQAVVTYVLALIGTYVLALVIDALAPTFNGTKGNTQALKVAAYSSTAAWVAGIFGILPVLSILGILGVYSLYLLYLGLPVLMKAPQDRALTYSGAVVVVAIVVYAVIGLVASAIVR